MESIILLCCIVVFGLVCLISGYHLLPLLYGAAGFAGGLAFWHSIHPEEPWVTEPALVIACCVMFICSILHEFLMMALVFYLVLSCFQFMPGSMTLYTIGAGCAIASALVLHKLFRPCMVILTAIVGAVILSQTLLSVYWYLNQPSAGVSGLTDHLTVSLTTPIGGWDLMRVMFSIFFVVFGLVGVWKQQQGIERG